MRLIDRNRWMSTERTDVLARLADVVRWIRRERCAGRFFPVILTSGHPRERVGDLPPGVGYMPKPWQPLNVLIAAEQALASARVG
jgi:hypothetical protein